MFTTLLTTLGITKTVKAPVPMSLQDAYEKIRQHFLDQKVVAVEPNTTMCQYRGPNGTMCAVGCLITDDNYSSDLEGNTIGTGKVAKAVIASTGLDVVPGNWNEDGSLAYKFLEQAQSIHDSLRFEEDDGRTLVDVIPDLDALAVQYGLTPVA
jgi:hypothetical protein